MKFSAWLGITFKPSGVVSEPCFKAVAYIIEELLIQVMVSKSDFVEAMDGCLYV